VVFGLVNDVHLCKSELGRLVAISVAARVSLSLEVWVELAVELAVGIPLGLVLGCGLGVKLGLRGGEHLSAIGGGDVDVLPITLASNLASRSMCARTNLNIYLRLIQSLKV
jgi:hypothetical protein